MIRKTGRSKSIILKYVVVKNSKESRCRLSIGRWEEEYNKDGNFFARELGVPHDIRLVILSLSPRLYLRHCEWSSYKNLQEISIKLIQKYYFDIDGHSLKRVYINA